MIFEINNYQGNYFKKLFGSYRQIKISLIEGMISALQIELINLNNMTDEEYEDEINKQLIKEIIE